MLAKALVYARTGGEALRDAVVASIRALPGTEQGGETLGLARNLPGYVIAADLVGLDPVDEAAFRSWLDDVRFERLSGRTLVSTHEDRPNNWGTHACAARVAASAYLGDGADVQRAADVFRGWMGDRATYDDFDFGDLSWQSEASRPVGINPVGATIQGVPVDGVLPDDQRRGGSFELPPFPKENYVWEGLQGAVACAVLLHRQGFDVWEWEDRALLRAFAWLHTPHFEPSSDTYPAQGDDEWQPHVVNYFYGTSFPADVPARTGKNLGYTDWLYQEAPPVAAGCSSDAECSDGVFCNGVERCFAGACQVGGGSPCDDGNSCTDDLCDDGNQSCASVDNGTCGGSGGGLCEASDEIVECIAGCMLSTCN